MSPVVERVADIQIDGSALQHNLARVKQFAPGSRVMAVIKANAYGHGLLTAAKYLSDADAFALAMVQEVLALRKAGITKPLVVLQGFNNSDDLALLAEHTAQPVIHQNHQIELLQKFSGPKMHVWLKVDTGMHRLGISIEQAQQSYDLLMQCKSVESVALMSHFANADDPENNLNQQQIEKFLQITGKLQIESSLANSAGLIAFPESQLDWVRPGIMLYGSSPLLNKTAQQLGLKPAMRFSSQLIAVNHLQKGDAVGYGSTWQCPEAMPIGVVAAGYGDGYPRHAGSGTPVWINNVQCPLIGRVSMDSICVDLRHVSAQAGDSVVLWGDEPAVDAVARAADSISYELLCNAGNAAGLS